MRRKGYPQTGTPESSSSEANQNQAPPTCYLGDRRACFFFFAPFAGDPRASSFHASRSFGFLSIRSSSCSPRGFLRLAGEAFVLRIIGSQVASERGRHLVELKGDKLNASPQQSPALNSLGPAAPYGPFFGGPFGRLLRQLLSLQAPRRAGLNSS